MKRIVILSICFLSVLPVFSQTNINISGLDPTGLLNRQEVELYAVVTDSEGKFQTGYGMDDFIVREKSGYNSFIERPIVEFDSSQTRSGSINFFLMVDNSGSMYTDSDGYRTDDRKKMRITRAEKAINQFLDSFEGSSDRIGLASFNTNFNAFCFPGDSLARVRDSLSLITRPDNDQAYTELYTSLKMSAQLLARYKGRTIIVVLSDGENYSWFTETGKPHPVWGEELTSPDSLIEIMKNSGITLFSINISEEQDAVLNRIAIDTGGLVFEAYSGEDLGSVYNKIRERVNSEYRIVYKAGVSSTNSAEVKIGLNEGGISSSRSYFSSPLIGQSGEISIFIPLFCLFLSFALFILVRFIGIRKLKNQASLEVLSRPGIKASTMILNKNQTVIGSSKNDDMTLAQTVIPQEQKTEVLKDEETGEFTLVSTGTIFVNNNPVNEKRKLSDGDLIRVGEALIVFDTEKKES